MDAQDFKTLGDCEFGTIWEVASEGKVVVNAYQAALYFSREDFLHFAKMVESASQKLHAQTTQPAPPQQVIEEPPEPEVATISDFQAFRKSKKSPDDDSDFTS